MAEKQLVEYLIERIEKIDGKVDTLLAFKWRVYGVTAGLSIVVTVVIQLSVAGIGK